MANFQTSEVNVSVHIENYLQRRISLDESIILDISIHESLNDNTTHGDITILDVGGFEERIPLIGQERININFSSKSNDILPEQEKHFVIYNMSPKFIDESKKQAYTLYFVSEEYISNLKNKVARSYKSKYGWEIVTDIYTSFVSNLLRNPKKLFIDGEKNLDSAVYRMQLVMAHFRPFECINLVAKRSVPARGLGKFIFYEDKHGYNFKSLESLLDPKSSIEDMDRVNTNEVDQVVRVGDPEQEENAVVTKYVLMPANARNEDNSFKLSAEDSIIQDFKFESTFNIIANMVGGMYSSRLITYDPVTQRIGSLDNEGATESIANSGLSSRKSNVKTNFYDFKYSDRYGQFTHIKGPNYPLATKYHYAMNHPNSCYKFMTSNFERHQRKQIGLLSRKVKNDQEIDSQVERWLLPNLSQNRQMKNIVLSVRVPGDHARTVGELVDINLPSSFFVGEQHKYYSGVYLISELSHKIIDDQYFMDMKLIKDNLSSKLTNMINGVSEQELLDAGADQSFIDALLEDNNTWDEDEAGEEY